MSNFERINTKIEGLYIIETKKYGDARGYFMETYHKQAFAELGITADFVQDNQSSSTRGVLRGMHLQSSYTQGKLVRVLSGEVFDAAVDLRAGSPTYGQWEGVVLSAENRKMFYVPEGFAHGFLVLSEKAEFSYKCTDFYHPEVETGIIYNDPDVGIAWPDVAGGVKLSDKDKALPTLKELAYEYKGE